MSESLRQAYDRIMGKAWRGYTHKNRPMSFAEARAAVRAIWKMHYPKRKFPWKQIARTSGNRYTWARRGVLFINDGDSWEKINHDFSHLCWNRSPDQRGRSRRPHCDRHLEMERLGAELLKKRFIKS